MVLNNIVIGSQQIVKPLIMPFNPKWLLLQMEYDSY